MAGRGAFFDNGATGWAGQLVDDEVQEQVPARRRHERRGRSRWAPTAGGYPDESMGRILA